MSKEFRCCAVAALAAWAFVSVGCGGEDKPKDPVYAYPDVGAFCNAYAKAECGTQLLSACAVGVDACVTKRQSACDPQLSKKYRPVAAEACVNAVRAAYEDGEIRGAELVELHKKCSLVFGGSGTKGSPCAESSDCDLDQKYECVRGACQIPAATPSAPGGDCNTDDAICQDGYYCSAADRKCVTNQARDAACNDKTKPCKAEFRCVLAAPTDEGGTCQDKIGDGQDCKTDSECANGVCILTSKADPDGGVASMRCGSVHKFAAADPFCEEIAGH